MPLLALRGGQTDSLYGVRVRADLGVGQERWLRWSAHRLGGVVGRVQHSTLLFLPASQKGQLVFGLFVSYGS